MYVFGSGRVGRCWGEWVTGLGFGFTNSGGTWGKWDMCLCLGCGGVGGVGGDWVGGLYHGLGGWGGVMSVCVVSLDYLCRWQVQVSVYCARRIPAHLRRTQCSILLHLIDICLYLSVADIANPDLLACGSRTWISFDIASHPARPHNRFAQKTVIGPPLLGAGGVDTICTGIAKPL